MVISIVIKGTGVTESLISGALSRKLKVLHLDSCDTYGGSQYGLIDIEKMDILSTAKTYNPSPLLSSDNKELFRKSLISQRRKLNLEKTPKMLLSRGDIVELLIFSGAGSYLEFELVQNLFFWLEKKH